MTLRRWPFPVEDAERERPSVAMLEMASAMTEGKRCKDLVLEAREVVEVISRLEIVRAREEEGSEMAAIGDFLVPGGGEDS